MNFHFSTIAVHKTISTFYDYKSLILLKPQQISNRNRLSFIYMEIYCTKTSFLDEIQEQIPQLNPRTIYHVLLSLLVSL